MSNKIKQFCIIIVTAYLAIIAFLYVYQRDLIYKPSTNYTPPTHSEEHILRTNDGEQITAWYHQGDQDKPVIVFFHGNAGNLGTHRERFALFRSYGLSYLAIDYRGYGSSSGTPTEEGIYQDARAAMEWLNNYKKPTAPLIIWGQSLGSGPAVQMALEYNEDIVVLEAPLASIEDMAHFTYPWIIGINYIVKDSFNNLDKISEIGSTLHIFHGKKDRVVPINQAKALFAQAVEPKHATWFDHNNHGDMDVDIILTSVLGEI